MSIATNPNLSGVMNAPMLVSRRAKVIVGRPFVRVDHRARQYSFFDERNERVGFCVRYDFGDDRTLSLKYTRDGHFADRATALNLSRSNVLVHVLRLAAKETFVGLDAARKRIAIFFQHLANLFEHAPRCFVRDPGFALKLFGRDTATSRGHEIDRVKPSFKRRTGLMVNRISGRMNMMTAILARVRFAGRNLVMRSHLVARLAKDAIGVKIVFEPFKTSIVCRELLLEILERIAGHLRALNFGLFGFSHEQSLTGYVPTVKG